MCSRTCPPDSIIYFTDVRGSQNKRKKSSNFQPKGSKYLHETNTLSSFPSLPNANFPSAGRLDGKIGSKSGILSPTNKTTTQTVSTHQLRGSLTANDMPAFRAGVCPANVCNSDKLDCSGTARQRPPPRRVSRRLSDRPSVQRNPRNPGEDGHRVLIQPRLVSQSRKVDHNPDKICGIFGNKLGHKEQHKVSPSRQSEKSPSVSAVSPNHRQLDPQAGATPLRVSQLCDLHHPPGKVALPHAPTTQQSTAKESDETSNSSGRSGSGAALVASKPRTQNSNSPCEDAYELSGDGCIGYSMGRPSKQRTGHGHVESASENMALQPKRDVCRDSCNFHKEVTAQQLDGDSSDRQSVRSVVHQERGGNQITTSSSTDKAAIRTDGQPQCCTAPTPPTGTVQHRSRQHLARSRRLGVAPSKRSNLNPVQPMGNSGRRSVRVPNSTRGTRLCYARLVRLERLLSRRVQQILALRPSLDFSATGPPASSATTSQLSIGQFHSSSTQVDEAVLAARFEEPSSHPSCEDTQLGDIPSGHEYSEASGSREQPPPGSLAHFGWDSLTETWSSQEKDLLLSCWRVSTLKTYAPIWSKWTQWCQQNNLNSRRPAPSDVARYLAKLYLTDNLAYRTILTHKSAIASVCETISDVKISSNNLVKHILKAVSIMRPIPSKVPIWDPRVLIKFLKESSPNLNSLYDVSRRTAVILLLSSGRRVHDLTLLRIDSSHFVDNNTNSITLHPVFGSKTDSGSFHQSSWTFVAAPDKNICPIFWLRHLIEVSSRSRGSLPNLFISTRDPVKPATPTIIGGWIKRLLSEAGIDASPGSIRSAVSSLNWIEKYPINDILSKANWRHENTFRKFYHKEIVTADNVNRVTSEKSLSRFFSAT